METVDIHKAGTHWFSLMERVSKGESFIISKAGMPLGKRVLPDNADEIDEIFSGDPDKVKDR